MKGRTDRNPTAAPFTREQFLDARLRQLRGVTLGMDCYDGCFRPGYLDLDVVAQTYGSDVQLRRVIARLKCSGCKRPPAQVAIYHDPKDSTADGWCVVLRP